MELEQVVVLEMDQQHDPSKAATLAYAFKIVGDPKERGLCVGEGVGILSKCNISSVVC